MVGHIYIYRYIIVEQKARVVDKSILYISQSMACWKKNSNKFFRNAFEVKDCQRVCMNVL